MAKEKVGKKILNLIGIIIFLSFFVISYLYVDKVFERKDAVIKNGEFLEEENDFDVLFFGNSHAYDAIYPMELWNQYGIFSYNLSGQSNEIAVCYWELVNALDYTTPELVVVDCVKLSSMYKVSQNNSNNVHKSLDFFPLSKNKVKAIEDLFEGEERISYLWKFWLYHSRWNELTKEDFQYEYTPGKGAQLHLNVGIPGETAHVDRGEKSAMDTVGVEYLCKMIELCQEKDIDILLVYVPFPAYADRVKEANLAYDIAEKYGVNYINFLDMEGIVNYDTDCYDAHAHLNPSGARKITEYLGSYIQENYGISDHRNDETYASWNEEYEEYTEYKIEKIRQQARLDRELMLLYDKNISSCIYVKEGSEILQDERMVNLIKNVSPYTDLPRIETAIQNQSDYFLIVDNGWCDIWESVDGEELRDLNTTFGSVTYESTDGNPNLFMQGTETDYLAETEEGEMPDVQIIAINKLTGEIVNRSSYVVNGHDEYGNIGAEKVN